jgi:hypothetical protein
MGTVRNILFIICNQHRADGPYAIMYAASRLKTPECCIGYKDGATVELNRSVVEYPFWSHPCFAVLGGYAQIWAISA